MNIRHIMNTRKLFFQYMYEYIFWDKYKSSFANDTDIGDTTSMKSIFGDIHIESVPIIDHTQDIDHISYLQNLTHQDHDHDYEINLQWLSPILDSINKLYPQIPDIVNQYAQEFPFGQMDISKQTALSCAYIENNSIDTPRDVIINEYINLCKYYSSPESAKMINGILHHIIK